MKTSPYSFFFNLKGVIWLAVEGILKKWPRKNTNKKASIDLWDSMASSFGERKLPTFENDNFLKLLREHNMLKRDAFVLDVGCGTGKYALSIAGECEKVIGLDFSPNMIEIAKQRAAEEGIVNVDFRCADWHDFDLKGNSFEKKFDLVFAHTTPAVQCAETFLRLSLAGKGWCLLSKPTRRCDPVSDAVKKIVGITEKHESSDRDIVYAFELLWRQGRLPYFNYEVTQWNMEKTLEQAYGLYVNRIKTYRQITQKEEENIKEYLQSIARDGLIREDIDTTITTLYWQV